MHTNTNTLMHDARRQSQLHLKQTRSHCILCTLSAIVSLVPVLSSSLSLPLSLPPDLIYPFPFLAQPVFFLPIVHQLYAILIMLLIALCFHSNGSSYAHSTHCQDLATISRNCEANVAIARFSLSGPPLFVCRSYVNGCPPSFLSFCAINEN